MSPRRLLTCTVLALATVAAACGDDGASSSTPNGDSTVSASETSAPLLNSERIEQTFGSYGIEVIAQDDATRVSDLYSGEADARVTRTLAVVSYPAVVDDAFAAEHEAIVAGGSIGATFRDAGWTIDKRDIYVGSADGDAVPPTAFEMMAIDEQDLALHVYRFDVARDGEAFEYATIAEFHHPDYLTAGALQSIFGDGEVDELDRAELERLTAAVPQPAG